MTEAADGLGAVQRLFHAALLAPLPAGAEPLRDLLDPGGRLAPLAGLAVYRRGYGARIAGAMRAQFPALCHALGEPLFNDFAAEFARDHPPVTHSLYDLGRDFGVWLEARRPDLEAAPAERERWIDFMIDLARFERQMFVLYDAPGAEGVRFADATTPEHRLRLQPAFALGRYGFDVADYHYAVRAGNEPPLPPPGLCRVALVRTDYLVRTLALSEPHYLFLETLAEGGTVADGIAAMARFLGIASDEAAAAWRAAPDGRARWLACGLFLDAADAGFPLPRDDGLAERCLTGGGYPQVPAIERLRKRARR